MATLNPRRRKYPEMFSNNVATEAAKGRELKCGHRTKALPIVSSPTARWWCDECRVLVGSK